MSFYSFEIYNAMFYSNFSNLHLFKRNKSNLAEWAIIELQGDLEVRGDKIADGEYIGDLNYDKYGQPVRFC